MTDAQWLNLWQWSLSNFQVRRRLTKRPPIFQLYLWPLQCNSINTSTQTSLLLWKVYILSWPSWQLVAPTPFFAITICTLNNG